MEKAFKVLKNHLKERGLRSTPERFRVLEEIYSKSGHFNADDLFLRLKTAGESISRATVYNTLELLVECHLVECHQFGQNQNYYERALGYKHHDHMVCLYCGKIIEFSKPEIEVLQDEICEELGFQAERHTLQIFGMCKQCQKK